jgi:Tfp pilus assembly protein PilV
MEQRKQTIIDSLYRWIKQRPGLEFCNYGSVPAYRSEMRDITKDLHHAREMLAYISRRPSITADDLIEATFRAYSARLSIHEGIERAEVDYCTGQYWPTEYRRATCAVLASAIWHKFAEDMTQPVTGDTIRKTARRELSRSVAARWFR